MSRQSACFVASVAVIQIALIAPCGAWGKASGISDTRVAPCRIEDFGVDPAVQGIARISHVPIGVEAVFDLKTEPTIKIDFPGGTLADLLDRLVSQAPNYRWREDHGVIHVLWHGAHFPLAEVVMAYPGADNKTVQEIWDDLAARPELRAWLSSNRCFRQEIISGDGPTDYHDRRISIEAGSMTLAQLMDRVAIKSGSDFWKIVQSTTPPGQPCEVGIFM